MSSQSKDRPSFFIDVFGIHFKVFGTPYSSRIPGEKASSKDPKRMKNIHTHFAYEVFFVTDGNLELVSERGITTYERKIVIIPPKIKHFTTPSSRGSFGLLFSVENSKGSALSTQFQAALSKECSNAVACELPITDDIAFYIRKISEKIGNRTGVSEKEAELLISLIFHEIVQMIVPDIEDMLVEKNNSSHINAIEAFINFKFNEKVRLSDVAEHVFLSTRQVSRIIQKEYGCTLAELVVEKKLASAEILIKNTNMKISDIAHQTNLGSENYFYSLFKKRYGMSPLKYRKQCWENTDNT